jgi:hypothetical protein
MSVICEVQDAETREQLGGALEEVGFSSTIPCVQGTLHLPSGMYLGTNLFIPLDELATEISSLALQITGHPCRLKLTSSDGSSIYT